MTGGNRGIGLEISRQLAEAGHQVILGAREVSKGEAAAKKLASKGLKVFPAKLDVTNQITLDNAVDLVRSDFGRLDILVNNAGILIDETDRPSQSNLQIVRTTLETNLLGPWRLCQAFIPMMKREKYGRIVNVSSGAGSFADMAESIYAPAYSVSKTSLNALTVILATELRGSNVLVNAVCPGWVKTDMGGANAPRSVKQGADTAVWLAMLPDNGPSGGFFRDRAKIDW